MEVPLTVAVRSGEVVHRLKRTVFVRRSRDGLSYAVRGYTAGRLGLGDRDYAALLTDGNGDGCFNSAGADRLWIDLDGDGRFDALTEQFLLGPPLSVGGRLYLVRPDALGTAVEVRERPAAQGTFRLTLPAGVAAGVDQFTAQLVSDWGELVKVSVADRPAALPVGRYHVEELRMTMPDGQGRSWTYRFAGSPRCAVTIAAGRESTLAILDGLALGISAAVPAAGVRPGDEIGVTPTVKTPAGLDLVDCRMADRFDADGTMAEADVRLMSGTSAVADRTSSTFL